MASKVQDEKKTEAKDKEKTNSSGQNGKTTKSQKKRGGQSSALSKAKKQIKELEQERDELNDLLLRKAAEFDNFKRRKESEFSGLISTANADLFKELLPVIDDIERSLAAGPESRDFDSLLVGLELIYKNLMKIFENQGVEEIEAVGKAFDPEKHDALMQIEKEGIEPETVVDVHVKGYQLRDRVLRHAQVLVSK